MKAGYTVEHVGENSKLGLNFGEQKHAVIKSKRNGKVRILYLNSESVVKTFSKSATVAILHIKPKAIQ